MKTHVERPVVTDRLEGAAPVVVTTPGVVAPAVASRTIDAPRETGALNYLLAALAPKRGSVVLRGPDEVASEIAKLARAGARVETIGATAEGRPIFAVSVGRGPKVLAAIASAHPDEPVGTATCLHLADRLLNDPALSGLADQITLHLVPQANPDGAAANAPWFASWAKRPDIGVYFANVKRDLPERDVEFGFPDARPENVAMAAWFDRIGKIDHYVSLHSMFLGGGALYLVNTADVAAQMPKLRFMLSASQSLGLPLMDRDRKGQKGFFQITPGLHTAPTAAAMREFFQKSGSKGTVAAFRQTSMDYVAERNGCPLAVVSEIPMTHDARLVSNTPANQTRIEVERTFVHDLQKLHVELSALTARITSVIGPSAELDKRLAALATDTGALAGDLERYAGEAGTVGQQLENRLQVLRRRAVFLSRAEVLVQSSEVSGRDSCLEEIQGAFGATIDTIRSDLRLIHPSLETQVQLQCAAVLAGLIDRGDGAGKK